jgi:hypothetical protein
MRVTPVILVAALLIVPGVAGAKVPRDHVRRFDPQVQSPKATLADAGWLVGHWVGDMPDGPVEQVFLAPSSGQMPSFVRATSRQGIMFYEVSNLVEAEGSLRFQLRHFTPQLATWESAPVERRLIAIEGGDLYFDRVSLIRQGQDRYTVYFLNMDGDIERETIVVPFRRVRK